MKSYCLNCRKNTENINPRVSKTRNGKIMVSSKCAVCGSKKSRFMKNQEAKGLLSNLGVRTSLSKVPILGDVLFYMCACLKDFSCKQRVKMNEIVNKFLLASDKFMPEMHLKESGFTYSVCGPFTKNKERLQKFKETGDTSYIYKK